MTGSDPYYGPLFSYLVALVFAVFGSSIVWPRLMVAIFGALTVPATYWLGRVTCSRRAGLVASLLALASRSLITVSSHYGWSNSLSPFFATVTLAACCEAYSRKNAGLLISSGLLAGLTVQTHPITATIVVGVAAWSVMPSGVSSAFRRSVIGVAVAAFLFAYAPVLWSTARSGVSILSIGATRSYAFTPIASPSDYLQRLIELCHSVWLDALAGFPPYIGLIRGGGIGAVAGFSSYSRRMVSMACGLAFLTCSLGASMMGGRRKSLIAFVLIGSLLLFPVFIQVRLIRYTTYLLPLVYVLVGDFLAELSFRLIPRDAWVSRARISHRLQLAVGLLVLAAITATPLLTLAPYYDRVSALAGSNRPFFELRQTLRANGACGDTVFLEEVEPTAVASDNTWAFFNRESIRYVLTLDSCPFELGSADELLRRLEHRSTDAWFVLSEGSVNRFAERFRLRKVLEVAPLPPTSPDLHLALYSARPR